MAGPHLSRQWPAQQTEQGQDAAQGNQHHQQHHHHQQQQQQQHKVECTAHIKDICYSRMHIQGHFDAPYEKYRLEQAVTDLVEGTGVSRSSFLPITCFLFKGFLFTLNNRRLWVLRHAFAFTTRDAEVDVIVLPDTSLPERKDYVSRLSLGKLESLVSPRYEPSILGDQPKLQKLTFKPRLFSYDRAVRNGFKLLPGNRLLCLNSAECWAAILHANGSKARGRSSTTTSQTREASADSDDDNESTTESFHSSSTMSSIGSIVDYPGKSNISAIISRSAVSDAKLGSNSNSKELALASPSPSQNGSMGVPLRQQVLLALPPLEQEVHEKEEEVRRLKGEVAGKFKEAVKQLRVVLDGLDAVLDELIQVRG